MTRLPGRLLRYVVAGLAVGLVHLLHLEVGEPLTAAPFLLYTAAIVFAAWLGGLGPGLFATILATIPLFASLQSRPDATLRPILSLIGIFVIEGVVVSAVSGLRHRADRLARARARQHAAVAEFSRETLEGADFPTLLQRAVSRVVDALRSDYAEILEERPDDAVARTSAGTAPRDGETAVRQREPVPESIGPRALLSEALVVFRDIRVLPRSGPRERLAERGVVSGVTVPIEGGTRAFGTLGVYTRRKRGFTSGDIDFLRSMANLLAAALRRRSAEAAAELVRERDSLLGEVSAVLSTSLDETKQVAELARIVVPRLADWCVIDVRDESNELRRVVVEHADPSHAAVAQKLRIAHAQPSNPEHPALAAFRTGRPQLVAEVDEARLRRWSRDAKEFETLRSTGLRSVMCIPLRARGRTLGVVSLGGVGARDPYGPVELALGEDLAARAALALDNSRLYRELLAEDRAKDEFLAMLAHELRNPLAPMVHSLEVMRIADDDPGTRARARHVLERQVTHMEHLVRDLLDVARISRGTIDLRREPVELGAAVADAIETSQPLVEAHRHRLIRSLPSRPIWLEADRTRLDQILTNLINNAIQHSPMGARTELSVEPRGAEVTIRVRDSGPGIAPAMLPNIFDLFARGERAAEGGLGLGIGLHLVRRLVELHGGTIEARSEGIGRGSEFIVRLPTRAHVAEPGDPIPSQLEPAGGLRILILDDHMDSASTLAELLGLWGHDVRSAVEGREALKVASEFHPDVVLLDIAMPGMSGYEVARELRRIPGLSATTIVALTGYTQEQARTHLKEVGIDHHFTKPIDSNELRTVLNEEARARNAFGAS